MNPKFTKERMGRIAVHHEWMGCPAVEPPWFAVVCPFPQVSDRLLIVGGNWNNGSNAGLSAFNVINDLSNSNANISARPDYSSEAVWTNIRNSAGHTLALAKKTQNDSCRASREGHGKDASERADEGIGWRCVACRSA